MAENVIPGGKFPGSVHVQLVASSRIASNGFLAAMATFWPMDHSNVDGYTIGAPETIGVSCTVTVSTAAVLLAVPSLATHVNVRSPSVGGSAELAY